MNRSLIIYAANGYVMENLKLSDDDYFKKDDTVKYDKLTGDMLSIYPMRTGFRMTKKVFSALERNVHCSVMYVEYDGDNIEDVHSITNIISLGYFIYIGFDRIHTDGYRRCTNEIDGADLYTTEDTIEATLYYRKPNNSDDITMLCDILNICPYTEHNRYPNLTEIYV